MWKSCKKNKISQLCCLHYKTHPCGIVFSKSLLLYRVTDYRTGKGSTEKYETKKIQRKMSGKTLRDMCYWWIKIDSSQQSAFAAQKANHAPGLIKSSVASRSKKVIQPLCYILMKPHLENHVEVWGRGRTWTCWSRTRGGAWRASPMKTGWVSSVEVAQPGEHSAKTSLQYSFQYLQGLIKTVVSNFSHRQTVIGQGGMILTEKI